jgi:hypothetical protein
VVVTRVRRGPLGRDPAGQVREALQRHAGVVDPVLVPDDPAAFDTALRAGRSLAEAAPRSVARRAYARFAAVLVPALAGDATSRSGDRGRAVA